MEVSPTINCSKCGESFPKDSSRRRHENNCSPALPFLCSVCGQGFNNTHNGSRHEEFCGSAPPMKRSKEPTKDQLLALPDDVTEYETAFEGRLKSYYIRSLDSCDLSVFFSSLIQKPEKLIQQQLSQYNSIKINFVVECSFENSKGETLDAAFKTRNKAIYAESDIRKFINEAFNKMTTEMGEAQLEKSGWMLIGVDGLRLRINEHVPLRGACGIPLPPKIAAKKACINVKNAANEDCFKYAMLAKFVEKNPQRVSQYDTLKDKYNFSTISTPTPLHEIKKFEVLNEISINVYGLDEKENVYPLKVTDTEKEDHTDLLLLDDGEHNHFVYIKHFEKLVRSQITKHKERVYICKRCFTHFDNQYRESGRQKLLTHKEYCNQNKPVKIELPVQNPILKFQNVERQLKVPFVIYADFEAILRPVEEERGVTKIYQRHVPMSFCVYVKSSCTSLPTEPYVYRGEDAPRKFMEYLADWAKRISNVYKCPTPMYISPEEESKWSNEKECYLCGVGFTDKNHKVRDHCHLTGQYRGAACNECNLKCRVPSFIPIVLHNLSGYDSHFIVKELGFESGRIEVIPNTEEKYISFTKSVHGMKLRFIDSFRFMAASLDQLVNNLPEFDETSKFYSGGQLELVKRKGSFPYDYVDTWEKLVETQLPPKEAFHNKLTDTSISDEDYAHALHVWDAFQCKTIGEYSDQYLKTDVLLLADVFETFRKFTMRTHKVDPAHYFTSPGMTWDAMLKFTGVKLELLLDYDMILMFERGIRGGICQVSHRYAVANNKYMTNYDEDKEDSFITYLDANNLYGHAMRRPLPQGEFQWVKDPSSIDLTALTEDSDIGYVLEVDVDYPDELHKLHNDYPFLADSIKPPESKHKKLIPNFYNKEHYVVHYLTLQQAVSHGLKLKKIHRAIQFKQSPWLQPYIDFNTELRKKAKYSFEKDQFKMYNNAVFGKTMESVRKRLSIELVTDQRRLTKLVAKPNFIDRTIYGENLAAVHMGKTRLLFDKPIYVGMAVLDLSKTHMYSFHYDVMMKKYGPGKLKLLYTDTDSTIYKILTEDFFSDMKSLSEYLDLDNGKVLGKFKDEVNGRIITKFIGLRPKMYAFEVEDGEVTKKAKGVQRSALRTKITISDYEETLFSNTTKRTPIRCIRSEQHTIHSIQVNKISLTADDDKRVILSDNISTQAYGYKL